MNPMTTEWLAVALVFVTSAFLSKGLARKKGRDEYIYFFIGLFLGPLAVPIVITPLPDAGNTEKTETKRPLRFIKGQECPGCHREIAVRETICPHCRYSLETPWWDRTERTISLKSM